MAGRRHALQALGSVHLALLFGHLPIGGVLLKYSFKNGHSLGRQIPILDQLLAFAEDGHSPRNSISVKGVQLQLPEGFAVIQV